MANAPSTVAGEVRSRANGLNAYVARMERLFATNELGRPDLHRVYGGAFMAYATYVERSLERLFLGIVMKRIAAPAIQPLIDVRSEVVARRVVAGGRKYVDWLPFERETEARALAFLSTGKPFTGLDNADKRTLNRLGILRNALAHESSHALRQFRRTFTDGRSLPADQLTPAGYLRGQHSPGVTRFTNTLAEATAVFARLCNC
jgi:hypothetical protein